MNSYELQYEILCAAHERANRFVRLIDDLIRNNDLCVEYSLFTEEEFDYFYTAIGVLASEENPRMSLSDREREEKDAEKRSRLYKARNLAVEKEDDLVKKIRKLGQLKTLEDMVNKEKYK